MMQNRRVRLFLLSLAQLFAAAFLTAFAAGSAFADRSIYFTDIISRLNLTQEQRPEVVRITERSEQDTLDAFARNGIDPDARPDFDKLFAARQELQAIERRERQQLKAILTKEQLKVYDKIMQQVRARVIKATRSDN